MYLFFVREFNDIDHITPIVWRMNRDHHPVAVYCLNPAYDIKKDYRLEFLKQSGVRVDFAYDVFPLNTGIQHRFMRRLSRSCFEAAHRFRENSKPLSVFSMITRRLLLKIAKKLYKRCKKEFYDMPWGVHLIEHAAAAALCFDHINPRRHVVKTLVKAAKAANIPTFALPHGVFIYTNDDARKGSDEEDRFDKFNSFDYIVTQNELRKNVLIRAGVDEDKISVLGSARYCEEWMAQNRLILPRLKAFPVTPPRVLKAVFMTTRFDYRIKVDRMLGTFDRLAGIEGIIIVVKPHTRSGKEAEIYNDIPLPNVAEISSVELCEWADIVLAIASSIIIEPLTQGKPVLYLKYLHENVTQYEELGACWTINDEDELQNAIRSLKNDLTAVPYTKEKVNRFLNEIIYGGLGEADVLKGYQRFIVEKRKYRAL
jgi:hypothetical protein